MHKEALQLISPPRRTEAHETSTGYTKPMRVVSNLSMRQTASSRGRLAFVKIAGLRRQNTTIDDRKPASSPIFHDAQDRNREHLRQPTTSASDGKRQTRVAGRGPGHSGSVRGPDLACVGPAQRCVQWPSQVIRAAVQVGRDEVRRTQCASESEGRNGRARARGLLAFDAAKSRLDAIHAACGGRRAIEVARDVMRC